MSIQDSIWIYLAMVCILFILGLFIYDKIQRNAQKGGNRYDEYMVQSVPFYLGALLVFAAIIIILIYIPH